MKDFLEAVYSLVNEIVKKFDIKKKKTKTWVTTIVFVLMFGARIGAVACGVFFLVEREPNRDLIVWGLTAVMTVAAVVFVIRGHLKSWEPY